MTLTPRLSAPILALSLALLPGLAQAFDCPKDKASSASACPEGALPDPASGICIAKPTS